MLISQPISTKAGPREYLLWRDSVCRAYSVTNCSRIDDGKFAGEFEGRPFGGIGVGKIFSTPLRYIRGAEDIRANPVNNYMLMLMLEGTVAVSQNERSTLANPGDLVIYHQDRPFSLQFDREYSALTFVVPEPIIESRNWSPLSAGACKIGAETANGRFATGLLRQFADISSLDNVVREERIVAGALDLINGAVAGMIGCSGGQDEQKTKLLESVKQYMIRNIEDADLDLEKICRVNGVSARTLNRLFASQSFTPMSWLWNCRLDASYEALRLRSVTNVTEAAFSFGFKSVSHFSSVFKKKYGFSPSNLLN